VGEYITLKEVGERLGVPHHRVRGMFDRGNYLEMVPRRVAPNGTLIIHRKDFERVFEQKKEQGEETRRMLDNTWESHFAGFECLTFD
jgi:hypothetical protein